MESQPVVGSLGRRDAQPSANDAIAMPARRSSGLLCAISAFCLLAACSTPDPPYVERPVEELYNLAMDELLSGDYAEATRYFDEVERQHPYSAWATRAQLMSAFASYQSTRYLEAILAAERYLELHPGHRNAAYAYYLIAISHYEQISDVGRDQGATAAALLALETLVRRFPDSEYARDARLKIDLTRDHLAGKEMDIGRYYLKRGYYVAAINRFRTVVEKYSTTAHAAESLHRLTEAYLAIGVAEEAQTAAAVLGHNFPASDWYRDSYALIKGRDLALQEDRGSWISRAWRSVF